MKRDFKLVTEDFAGNIHNLSLEIVDSLIQKSNTMIRDGEDKPLDFIIIDGTSTAILHLVLTSPEAELQCLLGKGTLTTSESIFLRAVTPKGEIPLGSLSADYNPGIDSVVVTFEHLHVEANGLSIYHGAKVLGTINSVQLLEEEK